MQTKEEVTTEFKAKLAALLAEYDQPIWKASIELEEKHWGYDSYSYEIVACIPCEHKEGEIGYTTINFGDSFDSRDGKV